MVEFDDADSATEEAVARELRRRRWRQRHDAPALWLPLSQTEADNVETLKAAMRAAQVARWRAVDGFGVGRRLDERSERWRAPGDGPMWGRGFWEFVLGGDRDAPTRGEAEWVVGEGTGRARGHVLLHLATGDRSDFERHRITAEMAARGWVRHLGFQGLWTHRATKLWGSRRRIGTRRIGELETAVFTPAPRWDVDAMVTLDLEDVFGRRAGAPWRAAWGWSNAFLIFDGEGRWVRSRDGELRRGE